MEDEEFSLEDHAQGTAKPVGSSQPPAAARPVVRVTLVTTDAAQWRYKVIDVVGVLAVQDGADADTAVERAKELLRQKCLALGGNAVVGCSIQVHVRAGAGIAEPPQVTEATAAGTVVLLAPGTLA